MHPTRDRSAVTAGGVSDRATLAARAAVLRPDGVELSASGGTRRVALNGRAMVVKRVAGDREAATVAAVLRALEAADFDAAPRLVGAARVGVEWYVVTEWIPGNGPGFDGASWVMDVAPSLLIRLRECVVVPAWRCEVAWWMTLAPYFVADEVAAPLVARLAGSRERAWAGPRTLAHGDCSLQNAVSTDGGPVLIDWEYAGSAPLGFDAGWLLAFTRSGVHGDVDVAALQARLSADGFDDAALSWFEGLGMLRLLFRARQLADAPTRHRVVGHLEAAVTALATTWHRADG